MVQVKDAVYTPFSRNITDAFDIKARAFWNDSRSGTIIYNSSSTHLGRGKRIYSPSCHWKPALKNINKHPWYVH